MSYVSGILILGSCADESLELPNGRNIKAINKWLRDHNFPVFGNDLSDNATGYKHPQTVLHHGGYNYFPEDDFFKFLNNLNFDWLSENVVIAVQPEEGVLS